MQTPTPAERATAMLWIRRCEKQCVLQSQAGHFLGHHHLYISQEATAVAACDALQLDDFVFTAQKRGVEPAVVDLRTPCPLDRELTVRSVIKTGHAVIADECHFSLGVGAELAATLVSLPLEPALDVAEKRQLVNLGYNA